MLPRELLAKNVRSLMDSRPALDTIKKVVEASDKRLSNGKVGRIQAGEAPTDIDSLGELAAVMGVEMWQLLVPNFNPKALPVLADESLLQTIKDLLSRESGGVATNATPGKPDSKNRRSVTKLTDRHIFDGSTIVRTGDDDAVGQSRKSQKGKTRSHRKGAA